MAKCRLLHLASGEPTPFDGEWLVDYDPARDGSDANGDEMLCHLVTTPDATKALDLPAPALIELIRKTHGITKSGDPRRPILAFSLEISA